MNPLNRICLRFVYVIAAIALTCVVASSPVRAVTQDVDTVNFYYALSNKSDACAWVTVYWSYKVQASWHIEGGSAAPKWVAVNGYTTGNVLFNHGPLGPQVRIQAEIPDGATCHGSDGTKVEAKYNIPYGEKRPFQWIVTIEGSKSRGYRVDIRG